jgi:hypothetical protein
MEILNISTGQESTVWLNGDPYFTTEYLHGIGKYSKENQFTAFSTDDG